MSKEVWSIVDNPDSYAFSPSTNDVNGVKFAALYTLQHGLARYAQ